MSEQPGGYTTPTIPPGWYPDPTAGGAQRWWDGRAWGPHASAVPPQPLVVRITNGHATAGLVLGIVSLIVNTFTVVSILGLIFSIIGITRAGTLESAGYGPVGRARAVWGLVLSILGGALTATFKLFLF